MEYTAPSDASIRGPVIVAVTGFCIHIWMCLAAYCGVM